DKDVGAECEQVKVRSGTREKWQGARRIANGRLRLVYDGFVVLGPRVREVGRIRGFSQHCADSAKLLRKRSALSNPVAVSPQSAPNSLDTFLAPAKPRPGPKLHVEPNKNRND